MICFGWITGTNQLPWRTHLNNLTQSSEFKNKMLCSSLEQKFRSFDRKSQLEISYHYKFYWLWPSKICLIQSACNNYPSAKENSHKIFRLYGKWYSTLAQFFPFDSLFFHSFFWAVSKRFSKIMIKLELCNRIKDKRVTS